MQRYFFPAIFFLAIFSTTTFAQVSVTVDSTIKFQTIEGWGHGSANLGAGWGAIDSVNYQYIDFLADDWGLTGTRITEVGVRPDGSGMDHGDCDSIDWSLFVPGNANGFTLMQYFKNKILAEGFQPSFYSSTNYASLSSSQKPWVLNHPGERAQEIWANAMYWRDHYGVDMNYAVIMNEPGGSWAPQIIADDIKALGPRCIAHGLATKSHFAECVAPLTDWQYITAVRGDTDLWPFVGRLSYHVYGTANPYREYIRDFGDSLHIPRAQTEMDPDNIDNIFDDLILGGVSYWEVAFSNSNTVNFNPGYTSFTPSRYYFRLRQVMHYVRPGAVRIGTTTTDSTVRILSFVRGGTFTTIVYNTSASTKTITVHGIPAGQYGLSDAASGASAFQELGVQTIGADESITISVDGQNASTIYPCAGKNLPPTIMTWGTNPGVLHSPTSATALAVTANDPEKDSLTYLWTLVSQPTGAAAAIERPTSASTAAYGLTKEGTYIFNIDVSDGTTIVSRKAYLIVYATNQPPKFNFTGFRLASPYGVVLDLPHTDGTILHTSITLPTGQEMLQANISDLENDPLTGKWTIVQLPAGATATLDSTTYIFVSFRSVVSNMNVPGDYVFQITASDTSNPPITLQVECTVLPQNTPPKINLITATPDTISLPNNSVQLAAQTSDAENDLLRHWWAITSVPPGAKPPQFDHQGLPNTTVSNLTVPGSYVFTLRCFDDISMTTKAIRIVVNKASDVNQTEKNIPSTISLGQNIPNPASTTAMIPFTLTESKFVTLKLFDCLGREVRTLLNERRGAGLQQIDFGTNELRSGTYFYRLMSENEIATKMMMIAR